ncbi:hypothetical protein GPALN_002185 [Globodera pallida]|nr:hypothetical protein GPALN_002185 [Globodera pallida]
MTNFADFVHGLSSSSSSSASSTANKNGKVSSKTTEFNHWPTEANVQMLRSKKSAKKKQPSSGKIPRVFCDTVDQCPYGMRCKGGICR